MKLRDLRGAIRNTKGNPSIIIELTPGHSMTLPLQKTPLLAELGRAYEDGADTGLTFDPESGVLTSIDNSYAVEAAASGAFDEDEDML